MAAYAGDVPGEAEPDPRAEGGLRRTTAHGLRGIEHVLYGAVAAALVLAGAALFGWAVFDFARALVRHAPFEPSILRLLDSLLLVFIVTELLHTVRAVIAENALVAEPFLLVGIIAAIRRVIVITAETPAEVGSSDFSHLLWETADLAAVVLVFGLVIYLLRHTSKSEPIPAHEPDSPGSHPGEPRSSRRSDDPAAE
ncbi:MAG: phosphate-starvation-inducible PsiE family protein [Ilumatobacteraceae bacterium]